MLLEGVLMLDNEFILKAIQPKPSPYELIAIGTGKDGTYLIPNDLDDIE